MKQIVELYVPLVLKDTMVDALLAQGCEVFYFAPCSHYGTEALLSNSDEQVSARIEYGWFRMIVDMTMLEMIRDLSRLYGARMITYRVEELE